MSHLNSSGTVTSPTGGQHNTLSSPTANSRDGHVPRNLPTIPATIAEALTTRNLTSPVSVSANGVDISKDRGGVSQQSGSVTQTYHYHPESGHTSAVTPASISASLPSYANTNNSPSITALDARSDNKSPDISTSTRRFRPLPLVNSPPSSAASVPSNSAPVAPASAPAPLRIDTRSNRESLPPPAPPPKSPRHWKPPKKTSPPPQVPAVPPLQMGSSQSKPSATDPVSPPSSNQQPQQQQQQQRPQPQRLQKQNTNGPSPQPNLSRSPALHVASPALSPASQLPSQARSPSPQPSQTFRSRSPHPQPAPIITSHASQAPSSTSRGQASTPTSTTGSFGSNASKMMRMFVGRRKKSEDATTLFGKVANEGSASLSQKPSQAQLSGSSGRGEDGPRAPWNEQRKGTMPLPSGSAPAETNALRTVTRKPPPAFSSAGLDVMQPSNHNRMSLITLSPGIASAVDYMRAIPIEEMKVDDQPLPPKAQESVKVRSPRSLPTKPPPPSTPIPPPPTLAAHSVTSSSSPPEKDKESEPSRETKEPVETKEIWRKSDSTIGHNTIRNGGTSRTSRPVSMAESFQSAHTIIPSSRPGSIGNGNKRWSTLTADMEFGVMVEEDGEESGDDTRAKAGSASASSGEVAPAKKPASPSAKQRNRRSVSLNVGISGSVVAPSYIVASQTGNDSTPLAHSISESGVSSSSASNNQTPQQMPSHRHIGDPEKTAFPHQPPHPANAEQSQDSSTGQLRSPPMNSLHPNHHGGHLRPVPPGQQAGSNSNLRERFTVWAGNEPLRPPSRTSPAPPSAMPPLGNASQSPYGSTTSFRATTVSITNSLAPAAGLARKAAEKLGGIGKKWGFSTSSSGSGYSSSSSNRDGTSYWSGTDQGNTLGRTNSNQSSLASSMKSGSASSHFGDIVHRVQLPMRGDKNSRRTPNAPSGSYSVSSSVTSTSTSESDAFFSNSGPYLGDMLRGPLKPKGGAVLTAMVFKRDLKTVTRQTRPAIMDDDEFAEKKHLGEREKMAYEIQYRYLPALVVRCAQHLLLWGVQEEGLFRVSGRASHISKLRAEFDTGADYDLSVCSPGDLDPHAVASVFKAYLRELPENILTTKLQPIFEACISQEIASNAQHAATKSAARVGGPGLPSNPKFNVGATDSSGAPIRKPPSLTTLSMPTFHGMPSASQTLVNNLRTLISRLPRENRDLVRTVVDLMKATYRASKDTKMPLSNLLLVFCPSLNMTPPLLKALCETEGIWSPQAEVRKDKVLDIKREDKVLDIKQESKYEVQEDKALNIQREDTVVNDASAGAVDAGNNSPAINAGRTADLPDDSAEARSVRSVHSDHRGFEHNASYSADEHGSSRHLEDHSAARQPVPTIYLDSQSRQSSSSSLWLSQVEVPAMTSSMPSPPLSSPSESVVTPTSSGRPSLAHIQIGDKKETLSRKSSLMDLDSISESGPLVIRVEGRRTSPKELPNLQAVQFPVTSSVPPSPNQKRRSITLLSLPTFSSGTPVVDDGESAPGPGLRGKRPSLRRLFTKRSTASLGSSDHRSPSNASRASMPLQNSPGANSFTPSTPRSMSDTSDSSVSTPLSAVTAPQSSTSLLPPVLDTQIDCGTSFSLDLGFDLSASPGQSTDNLRSSSVLGSSNTDTFYASALSSQVSFLSPTAIDGQHKPQPHRSPYSRQRSESSASNHLGMLEKEDNDDDDDWTQSVLAACASKS
ncbi:RhoGAP-domain-containing protein [Coprinopsis marcescibilis]|uniref:RhoGAP-domain-containing protein n=1 Tax=Coprinopsis marcescibilis TaxID=230819 RepID=A0A5C3KLS2_COPMA|nr:RhoGAP-domain-containing protein [Coprinopsis marcescibilis]